MTRCMKGPILFKIRKIDAEPLIYETSFLTTWSTYSHWLHESATWFQRNPTVLGPFCQRLILASKLWPDDVLIGHDFENDCKKEDNCKKEENQKNEDNPNKEGFPKIEDNPKQ